MRLGCTGFQLLASFRQPSSTNHSPTLPWSWVYFYSNVTTMINSTDRTASAVADKVDIIMRQLTELSISSCRHIFTRTIHPQSLLSHHHHVNRFSIALVCAEY